MKKNRSSTDFNKLRPYVIVRLIHGEEEIDGLWALEPAAAAPHIRRVDDHDPDAFSAPDVGEVTDWSWRLATDEEVTSVSMADLTPDIPVRAVRSPSDYGTWMVMYQWELRHVLPNAGANS